jgi:hypothetical protein
MTEGLYVVLGWTDDCLEKQIALQRRWVHALIGLIAEMHQEIEDNGGSLDNVVTPRARGGETERRRRS